MNHGAHVFNLTHKYWDDCNTSDYDSKSRTCIRRVIERRNKTNDQSIRTNHGPPTWAVETCPSTLNMWLRGCVRASPWSWWWQRTCIHTHIYIHTYILTYIHTQTHPHKHTNTRIQTYKHTHTNIQTHTWCCEVHVGKCDARCSWL